MKFLEIIALGQKIAAGVNEAKSLIVTATVGDRVNIPTVRGLKWLKTRGHLEMVYVVDRAASR